MGPQPPQHVSPGSGWFGRLARRPAAVAAIVFILGIVAHRALPHWPAAWVCAAVLSASAAIASFRRDWHSTVALIGGIFFIAVAAAQFQSFRFRADDVSAYAGDEPRIAKLELELIQPLRIVGTHFQTARPMPPRQVTTARVLRVLTHSGWTTASGDILCQIAPPNDRLVIGQRIRVTGMLQRPSGAMNPGQFDWAQYYREQRILTSLQIPEPDAIEVVAAHPPPPLARAREWVRRVLASGFSPKQSLDHALLRALVLGDNDPELRDVQEQFRRTGTSHHLAISGMHVAILGMVVYGFCHLLMLRPRTVAWAAMIAVIVYGCLALPSPPVVRSVVLCASFALGLLARRATDAIQLLAVSVIAMLVYHPLDLYNAGFQLSFGTVLGLMVLTHRVAPLLRDREAELALAMAPYGKPETSLLLRQRVRMWLAAPLAAAIIAWLVSLPLVAYHFEQLNPWAVIASLLLAPVVFLALIGGFLKIILTAMLPPFAGAWATMAAWPIAWMRGAVDWLALLPGSEVPLPGRSISFIIVYYALLLLPLLPTIRPRLRLTFRLAPACAVLLFAMIPLGGAGALPGRGALRVTVLAVGAGQCCVIEMPNGRTIVLDAGSSTLADPFRKCIAPFLRNRGISAIDELWISHTDYDHLNAAAELISAYNVKRVRISAQYERIAAENAPAERVLDLIRRWGVELDHMEQYESVTAAGVRFEALWPPGQPAFGSNDSGLVLKLTFARRTILFPADIEAPAQAELLRYPAALVSDVLIAPHHGSFELTTGRFVEAVDPLYVVSSNDRTLSQKQRAFERTVPRRTLLRTNRGGAVTIVIEPDGGLTAIPFVRGEGDGR